MFESKRNLHFYPAYPHSIPQGVNFLFRHTGNYVKIGAPDRLLSLRQGCVNHMPTILIKQSGIVACKKKEDLGGKGREKEGSRD